MTVYRLRADALLRLVAMASGNAASDPDAVIAILAGIEAVPDNPAMPSVAAAPNFIPAAAAGPAAPLPAPVAIPVADDVAADKLAKPE